MRDSQIMSELRRMETMVGHDVRALTGMVSRVSMRIDAVQRVLFGGRFSLIWAIAVSMVAPRLLAQAVDRMHKQVMAEFEAETEKRRNAGKTSVIAPTTGDIAKHGKGAGVIGLIALMALFVGSGCVTKRFASQEYARGLAESSAACELEVESLKGELVKKNARLRAFNQVDKDGRLLPYGGK